MKCVAEAFIAAKDDSMITDYSDKINDPVKVEVSVSALVESGVYANLVIHRN